MSMTMRERILEAFAQSKAVSVSELSQRLHTTVANIRYHLEPLLADQIIEAIPPATNRLQRGRPAMRFRLSIQARPDDLTGLSADLLSTLFASAHTKEERANLLAKIAHQRCASAIPGTPTRRLSQAVDYLNHHAYQARWEARHPGPEIRLGNCPYAPLLSKYPELCQIDSLMLTEMLDAHATIIACYQPESGFPVACIFRIGF
jgi:predicted ArsR family transcriptional regulator